MCHMSLPNHQSWFLHPNNAPIVKNTIYEATDTQFALFSCYFVSLSCTCSQHFVLRCKKCYSVSYSYDRPHYQHPQELELRVSFFNLWRWETQNQWYKTEPNSSYESFVGGRVAEDSRCVLTLQSGKWRRQFRRNILLPPSRQKIKAVCSSKRVTSCYATRQHALSEF